MKRSLFAALMVAVVALVACGDDDPTGPVPNQPADFKNLTEKSHVLNNIEVAYNRRNIQRYEQLLDQDFTFFLSTGDVGGGLPSQWDRSTDITANTNLFAVDPPDDIPRCKNIEMNVEWEDDSGNSKVTWVEITTPGGEKRYTTLVYYNFRFDVEPDMSYPNNPGAKVQFTMRNAGTDEAPQWKLVEMRDLGDPELVVRTSSGTESSTWGGIKAMYRN